MTWPLVLLSVLGCLSGRLLGPKLSICPFVLSALGAAGFPIAAGVASIATGQLLWSVQCLPIATSGALACYLSGHGSRWRSLAFTAVGASLGSLAASLIQG